MLSVTKKVLFVCVENSCRSQMAEAFAKIFGENIIDPYSSGSCPSGKVNEKAVASMKEMDYDLTSHVSKSLNDIPQIEFDYVVTMGCGDECPYVQSKKRENWEIPDPKNLEMKAFNEVRDIIKKKVIFLVEEIEASSKTNERMPK